MKSIVVSAINYYDFVSLPDEVNLMLSNAPTIEILDIGYNGIGQVGFVNNSNLRIINFFGHEMGLNFVDLKNGANQKLESIRISPNSQGENICIEADLPSYVESILSIHEPGIIKVNVTTDCGF